MKNLVMITLLLVGLTFFSSCEKEQVETQSEIEFFKADFDNFSVGVENNTLVFDSEEDLQECIDYLDEIGEENYDEFEKSLGYSSFRSTGKDLPTCNDPLMKTLINPNMENIICGYLTVSDFENEKAIAYRIDETEHCDLSVLNRDEMESFQFSFDDDFFEFVEKGILKSVNTSYCPNNEETDNWIETYPNGTGYDEPDDIKIKIDFKTKYYKSLIFKYLKLYIKIEKGGATQSAFFSYETTGDCFYQNKIKSNTFERSEVVALGFGGGGGNPPEIVILESKPYKSTRKLTNYIFDIEGFLRVNDPDCGPDEPVYPLRKNEILYHSCN